MTDEIKIWAVDSSSKAVEPIPPTVWKETEGSLEDMLVNNPDMLMPGLTLVGRQTPTESGYLDLLGVDADGRLVVFELKRGRSTRDAIAQAIDYCSYLESLTEQELAEIISKHSGKQGIYEIKDLEEWYGERYSNNELSELRPARIVLVGLGVDAVTQRMVAFLAKSGVDISLLTFQGYKCGDRTLLARQEEGGDVRAVSPRPRRSEAERRRELDELAKQLDVGDLWQDVVTELEDTEHQSVRKSGITFFMNPIMIEKTSFQGSYSAVMEKDSKKIRVTFYPVSVHLCLSEFSKVKQEIPFDLRQPPNAPPTSEVPDEWFCLLDQKSWEKHKEALIALTKAVTDAWKKERSVARKRRKEATT